MALTPRELSVDPWTLQYVERGLLGLSKARGLSTFRPFLKELCQKQKNFFWSKTDFWDSLPVSFSGRSQKLPRTRGGAVVHVVSQALTGPGHTRKALRAFPAARGKQEKLLSH